MAQEIYEFKFTNLFFEMSFNDAKIMLYLYSLKLGGDAPLTKHSYDDDRGLLLISVQSKEQKSMLINPIEYIIKEGDIGYVICYDYDD